MEERPDTDPRAAVPAASIRGLRKAYRDLIAVDDLSFDVAPGEVLGLVGPNGAGKTTTLRMLSGILPPTGGSIAIAGHDLSSAPVPAKRALAYIPDDPQLFENLTVREHLDFVARLYGVRDHRPRADALIARFVLGEKRDTIARELSRGMRQKVAIACAYLRDPAIILFDEPLTGLDPRGIRDITDSIAEEKRRGAGVIISSHLLSLVEALSDRFLILHRGRRVLDGKLDAIRAGFPELAGDARLEDVFFRATEGGAPADVEGPRAAS
ncbi:MAG: ABC transporter ATP-binding protein [Planctomycetes bacterium]|nr:ABC transporter ATP-binding protein [Planctomycetota bacterium]